jgi:hypothetical protein
MKSTTLFEDVKDIIIINTNQKKIGKINLPKSQPKKDYYATINEANICPSIVLSDGQSKVVSENGVFIFHIKATSVASAKAQAIAEAGKRYLLRNNLKSSSLTSNINIHVESNCKDEILHITKKRSAVRKAVRITGKKEEKPNQTRQK